MTKREMHTEGVAVERVSYWT